MQDIMSGFDSEAMRLNQMLTTCYHEINDKKHRCLVRILEHMLCRDIKASDWKQVTGITHTDVPGLETFHWDFGKETEILLMKFKLNRSNFEVQVESYVLVEGIF